MKATLALSKSYMEPKNAVENCQMQGVPYIQIARLFHHQSKMLFKNNSSPRINPYSFTQPPMKLAFTKAGFGFWTTQVWECTKSLKNEPLGTLQHYYSHKPQSQMLNQIQDAISISTIRN